MVNISYLQTLSMSVEFNGNIFSGWSKNSLPIFIHFSKNSGSHAERSCVVPFPLAENIQIFLKRWTFVFVHTSFLKFKRHICK